MAMNYCKNGNWDLPLTESQERFANSPGVQYFDAYIENYLIGKGFIEREYLLSSEDIKDKDQVQYPLNFDILDQRVHVFSNLDTSQIMLKPAYEVYFLIRLRHNKEMYALRASISSHLYKRLFYKLS